MQKKSKILVPLDGSYESLKTAEYAVRIAKLTDSSIIFLHVVWSPVSLTKHGSPATVYRYVDEQAEKAERWLAEITRYAKKQNVRAKFDIEYEDASVANRIVAHADKHKIDLIVVSRGKPKSRFWVGSVATAVVNRARCSVLLVK